MEDPKIVRSNEVGSNPLIGTLDLKAGWMKRIIYPPMVVTKGIYLVTAELNPGSSPHPWHTHTTDKREGYEAVYPKDFEEIYYVVSGKGVVQWYPEDGKIKEEEVSAGDTIVFPAGVGKHQLLNNGTEKIFAVICGYPTPKTTYAK